MIKTDNHRFTFELDFIHCASFGITPKGCHLGSQVPTSQQSFNNHPILQSDMWRYVEYTLGLILKSQRGRDAKLFHKGPAFANLTEPSLEVTSPECGASNSTMLSEHGKDGGNQFPTILWEPPKSDAEAKEYMVIVEDPDAPLPSPIAHGVYYAIPADTRSMDESSLELVGENGPNGLKGGFKFGRNRVGNVYMGPRPVLGHGPHRYFYQVIALSEKVDQKSFAAARPTREELAKAIEGKVLACGIWIGVFERKL